MRPASQIVVLAVSAALLAPPALAGGYSGETSRVLERARAASGGAGWYSLRGWHEAGREGGVAYERWIDPLRYGVRIETHEAGGLRVRGFNGVAEWQITPQGAVSGANDRVTLAKARTEAFFQGHCFYFPGRFDVRGDFLGVRAAAGRSFDVVRVQPAGGEPRELWFDRRTHLLWRMVDRTGPRPLTVEYSDYRKVGPVTAPFRARVEDGTGVARERVVESLAFSPPDRLRFSLPPPPPPPVVKPPEPPPPPPPPPKKPWWKRLGRGR